MREQARHATESRKNVAGREIRQFNSCLECEQQRGGWPPWGTGGKEESQIGDVEGLGQVTEAVQASEKSSFYSERSREHCRGTKPRNDPLRLIL